MPTIGPVVMIGAGGHAAVILEILKRLEITVSGVLANTAPSPHFQSEFLGDSTQLEFLPRSTKLVMGIGGARGTARRQSQFELAKSLGFSFQTLVHPSATVARDVVLGEGAQVMAGAIVQPGTVIGANSIINTGAIVDHDGQIGSHVHIAPGAALAGSVGIGAGTLIGTGASLVPGVRVGSGTIVGAGSVVVRDLPDHSVAYGVPCRVISREVS